MNDMILILNYADELSMEIARRLRTEQVYARMISGMVSAEQVRSIAPRGIILSGESGGKLGTFDAEILALGVPVLALGHASRMLLEACGGACADVALSEKRAHVEYRKSPLFTGVSDGERYLKEGYTLMLPADVQEIAEACGCTIAFEDAEKKRYGMQFELERNDLEGSTILKNFARDICGCSPWWSLDAALAEVEQGLAAQAARGGEAICAVSGGVDSTVAALLAHRAFGERMKAVFLDTGLLRSGEAESVRAMYESLGIPLLFVDQADEILAALAGKHTPEEKREVVVRSLYDEIGRRSSMMTGKKTLVLGTNYNDFLHNGSSALNWKDSGMTVVEPLLELFKDEVRAIAQRLGMPQEMVSRKPFPALGLGARIVGEITAERLAVLRMAETAFREEICEAGLEHKLYKYFPVMLTGGTGYEMIVLRAVTASGGILLPARLPYDLIERTVQRIMENAPGIMRVFYDYTPTIVGQEIFS
ncbi:MAG: phosphoadenosine phosphosulfate reductase family protein [Clostridia bacterium]|nr:phosphoadenosine phosphosulfate reductase family protein [Clostridia bacterium]